MSIPFKPWSTQTLQHVTLWSIKTIKLILFKIGFIFITRIINFRTHDFIDSLHVIIHYKISQTSFLILSFLIFCPSFFHILSLQVLAAFEVYLSILYIYIGLSAAKMISLYLIMVFLMTFWRSSLDIKILHRILKSLACVSNFSCSS